jgi:hypothetical protein
MPGRQTVSFAVTANGPAPRIRALLERVRPHVDEIVLAVDRSGDTSALEACADLADRRLTFELRDSPARLIGWVQHQCTGDWILRVDDDEVPSDALLAALPALASDPYPLAFHLRRHWVYPAPDRYIASRPWSIDYQAGRLVRNLPGAWRFDGAVHTVGTVEGEQRFVDAPLYHYDLLATPTAARRSKRVQYESEWPGVALGGIGTNDMYVPEEADRLESAPVPAADAAAIRTVIDGSPARTEASGGGAVHHAAFAEIDVFNVRRLPGHDGFTASVAIEDPPSRVRAAGIHHVFVAATNTGAEPWLWDPRSEPESGRPPAAEAEAARVRVGYGWRDPSGQRRPFRGQQRLTEAVWPGETSRVPVDIRTPADPGEWDLEVGVERAGHAFGGATYRMQVDDASARSPRSGAGAELAAMRQRLDRERSRTRRAEEAMDSLTRLRRYRVGAWLARRNGTDGGQAS